MEAKNKIIDCIVKMLQRIPLEDVQFIYRITLKIV